MKYAIYNTKGKVDRDPEPMIFDTRSEAIEMLNTGLFPRGYYVALYIPQKRKTKRQRTNEFGLARL